MFIDLHKAYDTVPKKCVKDTTRNKYKLHDKSSKKLI